MSNPPLSLRHPSIVVVLRLLEEDDFTVAELMKRTGFKQRQSYRICEWLRMQQPRIICVKSWQHSFQGTPAAIYGKGIEDAPFMPLPKRLIRNRNTLFKWCLATIKRAQRQVVPAKELSMAYEVLLVLRHQTGIRQVGLGAGDGSEDLASDNDL